MSYYDELSPDNSHLLPKAAEVSVLMSAHIAAMKGVRSSVARPMLKVLVREFETIGDVKSYALGRILQATKIVLSGLTNGQMYAVTDQVEEVRPAWWRARRAKKELAFRETLMPHLRYEVYANHDPNGDIIVFFRVPTYFLENVYEILQQNGYDPIPLSNETMYVKIIHHG